MVDTGFYQASDMTRHKVGQGKPSLRTRAIFNTVTKESVLNIRSLHKQKQTPAGFCKIEHPRYRILGESKSALK